MSSKINIENNKKLKENPFRVPEGYLDGLEDKLESIAKQDAVVVKLNPRSYRSRILAVAATLTLLVASTWYFTQNNQTVETDLNAADIAVLTDNGYVSYSETELLEYVSVEDLDGFWPDSENGDIQDYLESTDLDYIEDYYLYENM